MELNFTKMQGLGNDYIYLNCFENSVDSPESLSRRLSDRHFGIGGDGLVLIGPSDKADASMRMFNADGSEGKMCGNAIRCVGKFLRDKGIVNKDDLQVDTRSGIKELVLFRENGSVRSVRVSMGRAILDPAEIPVKLSGERVVNAPLSVGGSVYHITCVSMGNPHAVVFCEEPDAVALADCGPLFEQYPIFSEGVNTEFVAVETETRLRMRVWERGSGETLACGTGACAAAVAAVLNGYCAQGTDITVALRGGELSIRYEMDGSVYMSGPCETVFEGRIIL